MKTSIPKLHSIKLKNGHEADNVISPFAKPNVSVDTVFAGAYNFDLSDVTIVGRDSSGEISVHSVFSDSRHAYHLLMDAAALIR